MNEISAPTGKLLAFSMLPEMDASALRTIAADAAFEFASPEVLAKTSLSLARALELPNAWNSALGLAEEEVEEASRISCRILSPLDAQYPPLLAATKHCPALLYVRGRLAPSPEKAVAVIGARQPSSHGEIIAARVSQYFAEQGWSVVSGLDSGCDAIAHRAALGAKGHTIAVLSHGLHTVASSKRHSLSDEIIRSGGALVSEHPLRRSVRSHRAVRRARVMAGMVQGAVLVQSDLKGSSLGVCSAILDCGRWLAVPYPTESDKLLGGAKVSANLWLAEGTNAQKLDLLRRHDERILSHLIILRSKEDYAACIRASSPSDPLPPEPAQLSMF